jgi:holo-[acyl-carrier protein] synthase
MQPGSDDTSRSLDMPAHRLHQGSRKAAIGECPGILAARRLGESPGLLADEATGGVERLLVGTYSVADHTPVMIPGPQRPRGQRRSDLTGVPECPCHGTPSGRCCAAITTPGRRHPDLLPGGAGSVADTTTVDYSLPLNGRLADHGQILRCHPSKSPIDPSDSAGNGYPPDKWYSRSAVWTTLRPRNEVTHNSPTTCISSSSLGGTQERIGRRFSMRHGTLDYPYLDAAMPVQGLRVGIDLASVPDVAWSLERFGDRYLNRLFTDHEIESCSGTTRTVVASRLAARFAAKEAAIKVLRPGRDGLDWKSIEVHRGPEGGCSLRFSGEAECLATAAGISVVSVAVSHEGNMAAAVVAAICAGEFPRAAQAKEM